MRLPVRSLVVTALTALLLSASPAPASAVDGAVTRPAVTPVGNLCTRPHVDPCWARTTNFLLGGLYGCVEGIPLFSGSTLRACLPMNSLVEISCWFHGMPAAGGDRYQDHVVTVDEAGTMLSITGHVPDFFVDLGGRTPPAVLIPQCGSSAAS